MKEKIKLDNSIQKLLSILVILAGISLLIYMIGFEGEPGAIPLIMILSGAGWLLKIKLTHN